ncbi:NUDIX hydrolase [Serratia liquefaciens]|uniref:NUDIX hydrolase n=1 Tax=Serratia liquefaciens TaxID=614 RepID=UPI001C2C361E|nr:NUDIX hydrolase [Serratia liquefaciens]MBV0842526.1 NUDIX hydrolase [Serratia liquefaciens]
MSRLIVRVILIVLVFSILTLASLYLLNIDNFLSLALGGVFSVCLWFFTGEDKIVFISYLTARGRLRKNIKCILKKHKGEALSELEGELKIRLGKYFKNRILDSDFINTATTEESAALMFSLQRETSIFNYPDNLTLADFKNIARNASKNDLYRGILISSSLENIGYKNSKEIIKINDNKYNIGNDLKEQSDRDFINKLMVANQEEIILFSTTSQISSDINKIIINHHEKISKFSFFICSPFIINDGAIEDMFSEYNNPHFSMPAMQFIQNIDGSINTRIDAIRRVLKITSSLKNLVNISYGKKINIEINLFKEKYPGIKIKLLKNTKFLQIQPGNLTYANNLYRFGIETDSSKLISELYDSIEKYRSSVELVERVSLKPTDMIDFQNRIFSELTLWLMEHGINHDDIIFNKKELIRTVDDAEASDWIDCIIRTMRITRENIKVRLALSKSVSESVFKIKLNDNQDDGIYIGNNQSGMPFHITVAALFIHNNKMLIIKKSDPAYMRKYSVIAGHLENGESPWSALLREVKEEIGLTSVDFKFLKKESGVEDLCRYGLNLHDWYIFLSNEYIDIDNIKFDPSEIESLEWVSLNELSNMQDKFTQGSSLILKRMGYIN